MADERKDDNAGVQEDVSLRDYFAAHAPAVPEVWALLQKDSVRANPALLSARWAFAYADAMLKVRAK